MLRRFLRSLHVHWFRTKWVSYGYRYEQCRCQARRAVRRDVQAHLPPAFWWLEGRDSSHAEEEGSDVRR